MEGKVVGGGQGQAHVDLLQKYPKAVSFVRDMVSEHRAKQLEKGEDGFVTPLICLQPRDVTRSRVDGEADWPRFEEVATEAGIHFCESETVEEQDMPKLVQALLWDFSTNRKLSLEVYVREFCCEKYDDTSPADIYVQPLEGLSQISYYPSMCPLFQFTWC